MHRLLRIGTAGVLAAAALAPGMGMAQTAPAAPAAPAAPVAPAAPAAAATPAARPSDVATIDAIVKSLYEVVSGAAGAPRDWERMRSLFAPDGRMMVVGQRPDGSYAMRQMTPDDFIARNSKIFATMGFYETELARTQESFGQLAQVFSTYEARRAPADAKPFMRGINSFQLVNDGQRWYVQSLVWRAEDPKLQLPERYLQSR